MQTTSQFKGRRRYENYKCKIPEQNSVETIVIPSLEKTTVIHSNAMKQIDGYILWDKK